MSSNHSISRRPLLAVGAAVAGAMIVPRHVLGGPGQTPPSEKLNVAAIGIGGVGGHDLNNIAATQNIVALCDVDKNIIAAHARNHAKAKHFSDFRKMFDEQKDIDAVTVATPDHLHAPICMRAIKLGKHVHCQKPLTHSVYEARAIAKAAREAKVATQMGNYGHAGEEARLVCELIWAGAIGNVLEVHGGSNRRPMISPRGISRPAGSQPVPANLDWDMWLGPAPARPYLSTYTEGPFKGQGVYHPFAWRGWWDFGTGCLGDIGCHQFSAVFKALKPGYPTVIEASSSNHPYGPEVSQETAPQASITRWKFPAKDGRAAFTMTWWDGGLKPPRPEELEPGRKFGEDDWVMIVGDKGKLYGVPYGHRLIPDARAREYGKPPRVLDRSPGHYVEWINACKGGKPANSNFDHAGFLTEVVLLGNIALRVPEKLLWDGPNQRFTNSEEANRLINPPYRAGWEL